MEEKKLPVIVTAVTEIEEDGGKAFFESVRTHGMVISTLYIQYSKTLIHTTHTYPCSLV